MDTEGKKKVFQEIGLVCSSGNQRLYQNLVTDASTTINKMNSAIQRTLMMVFKFSFSRHLQKIVESKSMRSFIINALCPLVIRQILNPQIRVKHDTLAYIM